MAKVKGIVELNGTIGALNFYTRKGVAIVRAAGGGFNGAAIKNKPSMLRVRENGSEFGGCMQDLKLFKQGLSSYLCLFRDGMLHQRLVSLFTKLKDLDLSSERGKRCVRIGLQNGQGKELLQQYVISSGGNFRDLLNQPYTFDWVSGLTLVNFKGGFLPFTSGATHLEVGVGCLAINFEAKTFSFSKSEFVYLDTDNTGTVVVPIPSVALDAGIQVGVVFCRFVQKVNGVYYPFKSENSLVLDVVGVKDL